MKKLLFVFNPHAGKGMIKNNLCDIIDIFTKNGYEVTAYPTQAPLDGDFAWSLEDIKAGMAARKERLSEKKTSTTTSKKTPVQHGTKGALDLGF